MKEIVFKKDDNLAVVIPSDVIASMGLKEGEVLVVEVQDNQIVFKKDPGGTKDIDQWSKEFIEEHKELYERLKDQ